MFTVNTSSNPVTEHLKKRLKQNIADYEKPEEGERNLYPEGDPRQKIHQYTSSVTDTVGDLGSEAWEATPEPIQNFAKGAFEIGSSVAESAWEWNLEARKTSPSGMGLLDLIVGLGWVVDKSIKGVSQVTGVDAPIVGAAELFVPYGKVFSTLKNAGKIKQVAKLASTTSDLKGAEFAYKASQLNPTFNQTFSEFLSEDLGEVMFLNKSKSREAFQELATKNPRSKLEAFINQQPKQLEYKTIDFRGQKMEVPLFPGTKEELLEKVQQYIKLNEALGVKQPRKGWRDIFGTFIGEDGLPLDLEGGRATSKHPLRFKSQKGGLKRDIGEAASAPTGFKYNINGVDVEIPIERGKPQLFNERGQLLPKAGFHKHHIHHIKTTEPFGVLPNGSLRPLDQRQRITARLAKEEGIFFGNQDYNEIYLSKGAHLGARGDKSSLAVHRTLEAVTDIQGFGDWRSQATDIFVTGGDYGKGTWIKNTDKLQKGVVIEKYKMATKKGSILPGTYLAGQRHGFSEELIKKISNLKTDDEIISAVKTFYNESGMIDNMQGAAAIAQYAIDGGVTGDLLTTQFWKTKKPQMIEFANLLLKDDAYKNNKILKKIASGKF